MDEFLVSGETIIRNLQEGIRRGSAFGGVMEVGYLPDMFGHVAQMPQILSLAGFGHAVVWRGVPSAVDRTAFRWHAPDGSSVRAEYLVAGYGNGAALPEDAKALVRRLALPRRGVRHRSSEPDDPLAADERHRSPAAPALAGTGGGRGQPDPVRLRADHLVPARLPGRRPDDRPARRGTASCGREPVRTC